MPTETTDTLTRIRDARREISREFDNDPRRLVEHYMELQAERLAKGPATGAIRISKQRRASKSGK